MARKRHSDEDILILLRGPEAHLASGSDVPTACRTAGISDALCAAKFSMQSGS